MYASARSLLPCRQRLGQGFTGIHLDEEWPMRGSGISESFEWIVANMYRGRSLGVADVVQWRVFRSLNFDSNFSRFLQTRSVPLSHGKGGRVSRLHA